MQKTKHFSATFQITFDLCQGCCIIFLDSKGETVPAGVPFEGLPGAGLSGSCHDTSGKGLRVKRTGRYATTLNKFPISGLLPGIGLETAHGAHPLKIKSNAENPY